MNRFSAFPLLAAALLGTAACTQTTDGNGGDTTSTTTEAVAPPADAADGTPNSRLTPDTLAPVNGASVTAAVMADADFLTKAASGGMFEVEAAKQAQKSSDPTVKSVAQMIMKDHMAANAELKALAAKKDVKLPPGPIGKAKTALDKLMAVSGKEFDQLYLDEMQTDHEEDITMFEQEAKNGQDADIRAFAEKTLPTLRKHAEMVKNHRKMM